MKPLTLAEHRARIDHINLAEKNNKKYYARKRIHDYLPGQAIYNLGDYPSPFSMAPSSVKVSIMLLPLTRGPPMKQMPPCHSSRSKA